MSEKFGFEKLPGEPIGILTTYPDYDMSVDYVNSTPATSEFLDAQTEPIYFISNFLEMVRPDLDDVSLGAFSAAFAENPVFKHPNVKEFIIISNEPIFNLSAQGLDSDLYGNVKVKVFTTLEEALSYARGAG